MAKSPSDFSCHSYELFVEQEKGNDDNNKEKMSIRSEGGDSLSEQRAHLNASKSRRVSTVSIGLPVHKSGTKTYQNLVFSCFSQLHVFFD